MKAILLRTIALMAVVALAAVGGCSSDDETPSGPGGGGSGAFSLPAGTYDTSIDLQTCSGVPVQQSSSTEIWCKNEVIDELPGGLGCTPTKVNADSVTVNCSGTANDGGCSFDWTATGSGSRSGDMWTLNVHVEVSNQNPPACFNDSTCFDMVLSADRIDDVPSACSYADIDRFEATVTGGPNAGKVPFYMFGSAFSDVSGIQWSASGGYPESILIRTAAQQSIDSWDFGFNLLSIDPKSLPVTVDVTAGILGQASAGVGNSVYYGEYNAQMDQYGYASGGGGTMTVQEMSDAYIAGTIDLNLMVTTYTGPIATSAQETTPRGVSGGFFIRNQSAMARSASQFVTDLGRQMLRSLQNIE